MTTMFSWLQRAVVRASTRKRLVTSASWVCRNLIATRRPSRVSRARNTVPMPPLPSSRMSSYCWMRVPGLSPWPSCSTGPVKPEPEGLDPEKPEPEWPECEWPEWPECEWPEWPEGPEPEGPSQALGWERSSCGAGAKSDSTSAASVRSSRSVSTTTEGAEDQLTAAASFFFMLATSPTKHSRSGSHLRGLHQMLHVRELPATSPFLPTIVRNHTWGMEFG